MKLKINDEYVNVNFWSLLKCVILMNLCCASFLYILGAIFIILYQLINPGYVMVG